MELRELVLSFHSVDSGDQTQVISLYTVSHLIGPSLRELGALKRDVGAAKWKPRSWVPLIGLLSCFSPPLHLPLQPGSFHTLRSLARHLRVSGAYGEEWVDEF